MSTNIKRLLEFDPLDAAERLTGEQWGGASGIALLLLHSRAKEVALRRDDDTTFSNGLANYLRIARDEGFETVLEIPFTGRDGEREKFFVLFQKTDGILLQFDTFGETRVNGGKFLYNWIPNDQKSWPRVVSSGGFREFDGKRVWVGDHDCREALRFHLRQLREHGCFLTPWVERPFLWLLHYMDTRGSSYDYRAITAERVAMLPSCVREAISPATEAK